MQSCFGMSWKMMTLRISGCSMETCWCHELFTSQLQRHCALPAVCNHLKVSHCQDETCRGPGKAPQLAAVVTEQWQQPYGTRRSVLHAPC
jgi:hypothetical protein